MGFNKRTFLICGVTVLIVAGAVSGWVVHQHQDAGATKAVNAFASAWTDGHLDRVAYTSTSGADVIKTYNTWAGALASDPVQVTADKPKVSGGSASATTHVDWMLGGSTWHYDSKVKLSKSDSAWKVDWQPSTIHPALTTGTHMSVERIQSPRADILGANDQPIMTLQPTVDVGLSPQRVKNLDSETKALASLLQLDANSLKTQVQAAKPDAFVEAVTLRQPDYETKKAQLQAIPGTVFREGRLPLAPTRQFASALLGRVGPATAEIVKASRGRYVSGDNSGLSGLQQQYDAQLAGTAGEKISLVHDDGKNSAQQLFSVDPKQGQPLRTTLDTKTQQAAEDAIAGATKPTSFIAMRASTGEILADANGPDVGANNRAFTGQYPPGSSFKVVTSYALLQNGVGPDDNVACPPTITVDGKVFKNAENEAFASAPFSTDFAKSCNTAFISLAPKVSVAALPDAAKAFNLGTKWNVGADAFAGSVPQPKTAVDLAATAFGQGQVLASPLAMANVAAAIASGISHGPTVVRDPTPGNQPAPTKLDEQTIATLRSLMRGVVTSGTGTAVNGAPGGDVSGKTGTAEFGTDNPPKAHAWFIGYQNDIAFAAFVEGGEFGGDAAAPLAAKFLTNLAK